MEENYSVADEYNNREDIFEDIPEDQVEETEREIRNLRKWFDIFEKEYCDDEGLPDDDEEDAWLAGVSSNVSTVHCGFEDVGG